MSGGEIVDAREARGVESFQQRVVEERLSIRKSSTEGRDGGIEVDLGLGRLCLIEKGNDQERRQKGQGGHPPGAPGMVADGELFEAVEGVKFIFRYVAGGGGEPDEPLPPAPREFS